MQDNVRALLYPLGFIASLAFSLRFFLQWLSSEKQEKSYVSSSFWTLSLVGNLLMLLHTFIQIQYPLCLIQTSNAIISWRNLNLMQEKARRKSFFFTLKLLLVSLLLVTVSFVAEGLFFLGEIDWVRTPTLPWSQEAATPFPLAWHILGFLGATLFAMRFWVQWWKAEKHQRSFLSASFWWLSLIGALLALIYFIRLSDWVNILGYGIGIIPYARNLMLLHKQSVS